MSKKTIFIVLTKEFTRPREITAGNKTIKAEPGKAVEVPLEEVQIWLDTGRFEIAPKSASDLPAKVPGRAALVKANVTAEQLAQMTAEQLAQVPGITTKTAAEIIEFLKPEGGQQ